MLLERLRFMVTDQLTDPEVKEKCNELYRRWAIAYKSTPGMQNIATLYKQLPQRKRKPDKGTSKVLRETERDEDDDADDEGAPRRRAGSLTSPTSAGSSSSHKRQSSATDFHNSASALAYNSPTYSQGPPISLKSTTSSKKDKRSRDKSSKAKPFNFDKEKAQITQVITLSSIEATGLLNALKLINRERERVSENANARHRFETCKSLRRQTFRYCSLVMDEGYLGTLLNANDQLSDALILYEQLDRSFDYDSDSEDYGDPDLSSAQAARQGAAAGIKSPTSPGGGGVGGVVPSFAGLSLKGREESAPAMPPRPPTLTATNPDGGKGKVRAESDEEEDDEDDPFADRNAVGTPRLEAEEPSW